MNILEAKERFPKLIRAVENGEKVLITRNGEPVAELSPPPVAPLTASDPRKVQFDGMRDRIKLLPGWDDPIDLDKFLAGDL